MQQSAAARGGGASVTEGVEAMERARSHTACRERGLACTVGASLQRGRFAK